MAINDSHIHCALSVYVNHLKTKLIDHEGYEVHFPVALISVRALFDNAHYSVAN